MSATPARSLARQVLTRAREGSGWARELLDAALRRAALDPRETALCTQLVYGVAAAEGTLDEVLDRYLDRPTRVKPRARDALRVAAYELLYLSTEPRAAIHQGVELVKEVAPYATGMANAILRKLAEAAPGFPWGDTETDVEAIRLLTGHPAWLAELLVRELGLRDARDVMRANATVPPLYVAVNPFTATFDEALAALTADGALPEPCDVPGCIRVDAPAAAVSGRALATGAVIVADAAAQAVVAASPVPANGTVFDVAAGRGTKTMLLQARARSAGGEATITAIDVHEFKSRVLEKRMAELGVPGIQANTLDATDPEALGRFPQDAADLVFVDAPCSGLGTLRRHPEKRWRLQPGTIDDLAALGHAILNATCRLVRPQGFVVYSTCTLTHRENQEVVTAFLQSTAGAGFKLRDLSGRVDGSFRDSVAPQGWMQTLPTTGGPDGHFAALLQRN